MRSRIYIVLVYSILFSIITGEAFGQSPLREYSLQKKIQWQIDRAIAESIATANGMPLRIERKDGGVAELQRFEHGIPRIFETFNLTSAKTISTDKVWPGGGYGFALSGSTDTLGEWDGGAPLTTHQEFNGRILSTQGSVAGHSTHVAGTLIATGVQPNAHGMSYQAKLQCYDWDNDVSEMATAAIAGLHVSNHSYGSITGWDYNYFSDGKWIWLGDTTISGTQDYRFGFYDDEAQAWDNVAYNAPYYLIVKAAGNDRGEGPASQPVSHWIFNSLGQRILSNTIRNIDGAPSGYNTLNGASTSKNVLVVGAVEGIPDGYQQPSDVVMTSFSCWGPTDDGRVKPDIVADGWNLYSSYSSSNTSYATASGTSMATPSVTGSVGLLLQHQQNLHGNNPLLASTVRGLLIHTADDAGNPGPDYSFGWGLMNTLHAAQLMSLDSADGPQSHISERELHQGSAMTIPIYSDGTKPLKVTICWIDPPGTPPPPSLDPPNIMLVNDIDVRVIQQSNQAIFFPWILDPSNPSVPATTGDNIRDNVEQIVLPTPTSGLYTVRITHKHSLVGGSQIVSLIVSGNLAYARPIIGVVPAVAEYSTNPGAISLESLKVVNSGDLALTYSLSAHRSWLRPDTAVHSIPPFDSAFVYYTIDASALAQWASYRDTIRIVSNDTVNSPTIVPILLSTTGPKIQSISSPLVIETDSGLIATSAFEIHSIGTSPLNFGVSDDDSVPKPWLSINGDSGIIAPDDSSLVNLTINAKTLNPGDYIASLKIVSNDSSTGTVHLSLHLTVFNGITIHVSVDNSWNLISVPLLPSDNIRTYLYPTCTSPAYSYSGAYSNVDTLNNGVGYWLRFGSNQTVLLHGSGIVIESIKVDVGWNLIGSISYPILVSTVGSDSSGMITSNFFGYSNGYKVCDSIIPGKGYWVKVNRDGCLFLSYSGLFNIGSRITIIPTPELPPHPPAQDHPGTIIPTIFGLEQAYPNPFNPTTTVQYELPVKSTIILKVYNVLGQVVQILRSDIEDAGYKNIEWNASNFVSGVYFYRLEAISCSDPTTTFTQTRKMVLLK
jgi:hypothetical protein